MQDNIAKNARSRAKDPAQERLREHKDAWNDVTSLLIAKLIAFKKGLNGAGDPRAEIPPTKITEPFPVEMNTYLSSIVDDYTHIMNGARFIMNEQGQYSQTRQKGKEAATDPELVAEASSALTRAWARVGLLGLDKEERRLRLGMLSFANGLIHDLYNLENELTSRDPNGHARAVLDMSTFLQEFAGGFRPMLRELVDAGQFEFEAGLKAFQQEYGHTPTREEVEEAGGWVNFTKQFRKQTLKEEKLERKREKNERKQERQRQKDERARAKEEKEKPQVPSTQDRPEPEYAEKAPGAPSQSVAQRLLAAVNQVRDKDLADYEAAIRQLEPGNERNFLSSAWNELSLAEASLKAAIKEDPLGLILSHSEMAKHVLDLNNNLAKLIKSKRASVTAEEMILAQQYVDAKMPEIEKLAHNIVTRWINKKLLEFSPSKSGVIALDAVREINRLNANLNALMDLLEDKKADARKLYTAYRKVTYSMKKITERLLYLGKIYILDKKRRNIKRRDYLPITDKDLRDLERIAVMI
jgi:hypothetical protein